MERASSPTEPERSSTRCCCGKTDCRHNVALSELERDIQQAARLGQALLIRHETYMASSEQELAKLNHSIKDFECDKVSLEAENTRIAEENRQLMEQLESMNQDLLDSDDTIKRLNRALQSAQEELDKMAASVSRAERMEKELQELEADQKALQEALENSQEGERSATYRWRNAERLLLSLEGHIERIEREMKEERERHFETVARLRTASKASDLKGNLPTKSSTMPVSSFVRDIMQDNANLQILVGELKELLTGSNDEIEKLREELIQHQPMERRTSADPQPLHIHHHYHAPAEQPTVQPRAYTPMPLKSKKRRSLVTTGHFKTASTSQPRTSSALRLPRTPSSPATVQTTCTPAFSDVRKLSNPLPNEYPFTPATPSTVYTNSHRASSIFDTTMSDFNLDSSRPTSPESLAPFSPVMYPVRSRKPPRFYDTTDLQQDQPRIAEVSADVGQRVESRVLSPNSEEQRQDSLSAPMAPNVEDVSPTALPELSEDGNQELVQSSSKVSNILQPTAKDDMDLTPTESSLSNNDTGYFPKLRRTVSHESLLSISGMDIHTGVNHPVQRILATDRTFGSPRFPAMTGMLSTQPVISAMNAVARPEIAQRRVDSSSYTRHLLATQAGAEADKQKPTKPTVTRKTSGWGWGKWGGRAVSIEEPVKAAVPEVTSPGVPMFRSPGINQSGPIFGLGPSIKAPSKVQVTVLDEDALRESLGDG